MTRAVLQLPAMNGEPAKETELSKEALLVLAACRGPKLIVPKADDTEEQKADPHRWTLELLQHAFPTRFGTPNPNEQLVLFHRGRDQTLWV